jgi:hypothetical protein
MSFLERAKAAANDLAAKADVAMSQAGISTPGTPGGGDRALRDLGVLAYLEATGRGVNPADRDRLLATLRELESSGRLGPLTVSPPPPHLRHLLRPLVRGPSRRARRHHRRRPAGPRVNPGPRGEP